MASATRRVPGRFVPGVTGRQLASGLAADPSAATPHRGAALTGPEREFLVSHGADEKDLQQAHGVLAEQHPAVTMAAIAAGSLTTAQAADLLGISARRVRRRVAEGGLYALRLGRRLRLPLWQFTDGTPAGPLPGLRRLLGAVPVGLSPVTLAALMTEPQPDLVANEHPVTPRAWLLAGGSVDTVCGILADPNQW